MRILTDDGRGHGMPTRANILAGLRWLAEGVQPGDCLFLHFSGHGAQQEDPSYAEEDGYDETICPTDFNSAGMICQIIGIGKVPKCLHYANAKCQSWFSQRHTK